MRYKFWLIPISLMLLLSGRISGQSFTLRPTAYETGAGGPFSEPALAYDDNFTSASVGTAAVVGQGHKGGDSATEIWYGFPSAPPGASGLELNISSSASIGHGGTAVLYYSTDGGSTFQQIYLYLIGSHPQSTVSVSLSSSQDLTKIQVKAQVTELSDGTFAASSTYSIYEVWISGTT
jgi:hypothetical protein